MTAYEMRISDWSSDVCSSDLVDGLFVQGKYQIKPPVPFTPGGEVAGDVVAVGEGVDSVAIGDRVLAMSFLGGYASHVEVPAASVVPVPASLSYGQAAGLVQSYGTLLFRLTRPTHGGHGGGGGSEGRRSSEEGGRHVR